MLKNGDFSYGSLGNKKPRENGVSVDSFVGRILIRRESVHALHIDHSKEPTVGIE